MIERKRVVFLTFYYEAWDALAEIHRLMLGDERFDVQVVAIDRRLTGEVEFSGASQVSKFFDEHGVSHLVNADLAELAPDYIVVNYPWQRNYAPQYRPDVLASIGRIVYVPYYSLPLVQEPADGVNPESGFLEHAPHLYSQRMHQLTSIDARKFGSTKLDALVSEVHALEGFAPGVSANAAEAAVGAETHSAGHRNAAAAGHRNAEAAGHRNAEAAGHRKTLLWAPHHSYSPHWLNFGNFARVHEEMLNWAAAQTAGPADTSKGFEVVLRAHPFMFGTLVDRGVMAQAELDDWLARWNALPNTRVEVGESAAASFAAADYLLTDGISFLAEWPLAKNVPAIFLQNPDHWPFTELGEICGGLAVKLPQISGLDAAISECAAIAAGTAAATGGGAEFNAGLAKLRALAMPNAGHTAAKIIEAIATDNSPLIDPATVTEVPWELQPGREPLGD